MKPNHSTLRSVLALCAAILAFGCDSGTGLTKGGTGILKIRLTDAPFPTDEVRSVDVFIVRVDARTSDVGDAEADQALSDESSSASGWKTIVRPNGVFDLLSLQDGHSLVLGQSAIPAGTYAGFRLVIDQSKSSVTLKTGLVLNGGSTPGIKFPSAEQSGLKIQLAQPLLIKPETETELVVDFDVAKSFVMRGNTIDRNGLLFKPVVRAAITNLALTNARVRLANATDSPLSLLQSGSSLPGSSDIAFGANSACNSVAVSTASFSIVRGVDSIPLAVTLTAGHPTTFVAYLAAAPANAVTIAPLENQYVPETHQAGFRVFNSSTPGSPINVFVTAEGAPLGTPTFSNIAAGASSGFVSLPPGTAYEIRAVGTGTNAPPIMELHNQALNPDENTTLVVAPPTSSTAPLRGFLVPSC